MTPFDYEYGERRGLARLESEVCKFPNQGSGKLSGNWFAACANTGLASTAWAMVVFLANIGISIRSPLSKPPTVSS